MFICLFLGSQNIIAEPPTKPDRGIINLYVDAGTYLIIHSAFINLETQIASSRSEKLHLYLRGAYGTSHMLAFGSGKMVGGQTSIGALTLLTGEGNHHFEAGGGVFHIDDIIVPFIDLGYRFQKPEGGFIFRGKAGILGIGLGIGYAF